MDRQEQMVGSYAPKAEPYVFELPPQVWPKGMLARGSYTARVTFHDDDKNIHLKHGYAFDIKKNWASDDKKA